MKSEKDQNLVTEVCWIATKKFQRRVPKAQIKYVKTYWDKLKYKNTMFGYGFILVPITNMIYFYSEYRSDKKLYRKLWYATTINEIVSGDFLTSGFGS